MKVNEYGLNEDDLGEIVEFFEAYTLQALPEGTEREDLPISSDVLEMLLSDMGFLVTEAELIQLKEKLDPEGEGHITLERFVMLSAGPLFQRTRLNEDNAEEVFGIFDSDGDGLVRKKDLRDVLALFGEELPDSYLQDIINEVDMDGDKAIGLDEFKFFAAGEIF